MMEEEKEEEVTQDCPESLLNVMKALQLKKHVRLNNWQLGCV